MKDVMEQPLNLRATKTPVQDIQSVAYEGQNPKLRMHKAGYENYFNSMPVLNPNDPLLQSKTNHAHEVMKALADELQTALWVSHDMPLDGEFDRTILALEKPEIRNGALKEGNEIIVARWGNGFTSPVHGHKIGLLDEEMIKGKFRVTLYGLVNPYSKTVRPIRTDIVDNGTIVSTYVRPGNQVLDRQAYIHSFTSIGQTASLHFVPEHTRDGRDNQFEVQRFEDLYQLNELDVIRISSKEGMYLQKGDVVLVRSTNVPEYGDHFIVVTGAPEVKEHGLRPKDTAIEAPNTKNFLDSYEMQTGLILLKLRPTVQKDFLDFHAIKKDEHGEIIFPNPNEHIFY